LLAGGAGERVLLREAIPAGAASQVRIELKAQGLFRPGLPPGDGATEPRRPKPLSLEIQTRLVFIERLVPDRQNHGPRPARTNQVPGPADSAESPGRLKAVRQVLQAASAINGEVRPTAAMLRPEVSLLVAERRDRDGPVVVASPFGPLTRSELELVEGLGDPLALAGLLPPKPVVPGEHWRVHDWAAQAVSGYDQIVSNDLTATLESVDAARARIRLNGVTRGSALGGSGTITVEGFLTFDRRLAGIDQLELSRVEVRQPGPIEAGLDVKSSLSMRRQPVVPPATLGDAALAGVPLEITPEREMLRLSGPDGKSTLVHDRHWHLFWVDPKLIVLKRLDQGQVVAQCNIALGPAAAKGRHQDPNQFRDDIRRALKQRFVEFLGAGEVAGHPAGGFRYKVGVQGREGDFPVVWYYYLLASPEGDQLLATYTLAADHAQAFGEEDLKMIGTLQWSTPERGASHGDPRGISQAGHDHTH
jgi:hypothetical protein